MSYVITVLSCYGQFVLAGIVLVPVSPGLKVLDT